MVGVGRIQEAVVGSGDRVGKQGVGNGEVQEAGAWEWGQYRKQVGSGDRVGKQGLGNGEVQESRGLGAVTE